MQGAISLLSTPRAITTGQDVLGRASDGAMLCEESEAFLHGRLVELAGFAGVVQPAWVELNWVAHAPSIEIHDAATGGPEMPEACGRSWNVAVAVICAQLVDLSDGDLEVIEHLQHECLVPLELDLLRPAAGDPSPRELLIAVGARLRAHPQARGC